MVTVIFKKLNSKKSFSPFSVLFLFCGEGGSLSDCTNSTE